MGIRSEYGFTKQEYDHALFYNKRRFEIIFEGVGAVDNSPDVDMYLKIDGKYRALYVPENTFCLVNWLVIVYDGTTTTTQTEVGTLTRASGGNVTYTGGAVGTIDPTVTPTANTTVQGLEVVVSDANSEASAVYVVAKAEILVIHTLATGQSKFTTAATAALTSAE